MIKNGVIGFVKNVAKNFMQMIYQIMYGGNSQDQKKRVLLREL